MRVQIPNFATKRETFEYLKAKKGELIAKKKSMPIHADPFSFGTSFLEGNSGLYEPVEKSIITKDNSPVMEDVNRLKVRVVANTANWIDSHMDMLLADAPLKSIKERKGLIPHLHDHEHTLDSELGDVLDIYLSNMSLRELGVNMNGNTQALVFLTDLIEEYNPKVFKKYKQGRIKQHSIGLQYVQLDLAINDPDSIKEYEFWTKYYDICINKEVADARGFFWVVTEYKLIENSAVLFGSNILTPTLDNNVKTFEPGNHSNIKGEPSKDTRVLSELEKLLSKIKN